MNEPTKLNTRFLPETRFNLKPHPAVSFRGGRETELEQVKEALLRDLLAQTAEGGLYAPLRRAANEAAALAWTTPYPLLFLPALLEEKAALARHQFQRQQAILRRGRVSVSEVAA